MTVATTLTALAAVLSTITSPAAPAAVYANPREATSIGELPVIILTESATTTHTWTPLSFQKGGQVWNHQWSADLFLLVGPRGAGLPDLHGRLLGWPESITRALGADLTLGSTIESLGHDNGQVWQYRIGPQQWGDQQFFGLRGQIAVTEFIQP